MKLPRKDSVANRMIEHLFDNIQCTTGALIDLLSMTSNRDRAVNELRKLRDEGLIVSDVERYSADAKLWLCEDAIALVEERRDGSGKKAYRGEIVPPAERNVFGTTISKKNIPTVFGMRDGSNDYLAWPSKYA